jgi:hypothetical protein
MCGSLFVFFSETIAYFNFEFIGSIKLLSASFVSNHNMHKLRPPKPIAYFDKAIPVSERYSHVRATIDTVSSGGKYRGLLDTVYY